MRIESRLLTAVVSALLLVNCGGGSSSSSQPQPPVVVEPDNGGNEPTQTVTLVIDNTRVESERDNTLSIQFSEAVSELPTLELWLNDGDNVALTSHALTHNAELADDGLSVAVSFNIADGDDILHRATPVKLFAKAGEQTAGIDLSLYDVPPMSELNWPQRLFFADATHLDPLLESNSIVFQWLNLDPWAIPDDPTWEEDPYTSISWRMFYHSLGWMTGFGRRYAETGEAEYLERLDFLLADYDQTFPDPEEAGLAYREDAVSLRLNHLIYLYLNVYRDMPAERRVVIETLIDKASSKLMEYLTDIYYDSNNHGMIQGRAALNVVMALPRLAMTDALADAAVTRTERAAIAMFTPQEGMSKEQAPGYHYAAVAMLLESELMLQMASLPVPDVVEETLKKSLIIGAYLLNEDGTLPAIGDTQFNEKFDHVMRQLYRVYNRPIPQVDAFYNEGIDALADVKLDPEEGLLILKHRHNSGNLSKLFFDAGPMRHIHGHFDNLAIVGQLDGEKLLIDAGGPYGYGTGHRIHFVRLSSHNSLLINNEVGNKYDAEMLPPVETGHNIFGGGSQKTDPGLVHHRAFAMAKGDIPFLLVVDEVEQSNEDPNWVRSYWHFPPDSKVDRLSDTHNRVTLPSGKQYQHYQTRMDSEICFVAEGLLNNYGDYWLGWATTAFNVAVPAPIELCYLETNRYQKVNVFTSAESLETQVTDRGETLSIKVGERQYTYNKATRTLSE